MSEARSPWNSSCKDADLPSTALNERFDSASELALDPDSWHMFSPGQTLALMHAIGFLHGDLHREHMCFDADTGHSLFIDFGASRMNEAVDPRACAVDFAPAYMSLDRNEFHALLSGYINVSQTYVDSLRPGFTHELVDALGITLGDYVAPQDSSIDPVAVLDSLGVVLRMKSGRLITAEARNLTIRDRIPDFTSILRTVCGLMLSGVNCSVLATRLRSTLNHQSDVRAAALNFLFDEQSLPAPEDADPITTQVVVALKHSHLHSSNTTPEPTSQLASLAKCLKYIQPEVSAKFVDCMIDVADHLAKDCLTFQDIEARRPMSMSLAQHSQMLLLMILGDAKQDEQRFLTMLRRSYSLDWMLSFLGSEEADELTLHELVYANSRSSVLLRAFGCSLADDSISNPRWSAMWRCLNLTQQCVLALRRLLSDESFLESHQATLVQLTPLIIHKFGATLSKYGQSLMVRGKFNAVLHSWAKDDSPMMKLLEATKKLLDLLGESDITTASTLSAFDDMITSMKIDRPFASASMVKR